SPASARGLDLHFDFHDVLVVQLSGSKRWRVWDRLDRTATPVRGAPHTHAPTIDEVGEARFDRILEAGDCLHVPRGCPHSPETVDEASAHLTIGIMSFTRRRLVEQALTRAVGEPATSTLVPPGGLGGVGKGGESQLSAAATGAESALGLLATRLAGPALRRQLAIEVWRRQPVTRLRSRVPVEALGDALLAVTPGPLVWAERRGRRRRARPRRPSAADAGRGVAVAAPAARRRMRVVHHRRGRPVTAAQLDAESVRTVVERLIAEGVVAHATV
ncbi:MAG: cupin domain-containing protein, partial [Ilumatobacteraceae bacterium]